MLTGQTKKHQHSFTELKGKPVTPTSPTEWTRINNMRMDRNLAWYECPADDRIILYYQCACSKELTVDMGTRERMAELYKAIRNRSASLS